MERSERKFSGLKFATAPNIDAFAFDPVQLGFWKQHELWDGTYTIDDLLDIHEVIDLKNENEYRVNERRNNKDR